MRINKITSSLFIAAVTTLNGCSGGEDSTPSRQDIVANLLTSGNWKTSTVQVEGVQEIDYLSNLAISFSATTLNVSEGEPIFSEVDSWAFLNDEATSIITGGGLQIELLEIDESSLEIMFMWNSTTLGSGRANSIGGEHVITFSK